MNAIVPLNIAALRVSSTDSTNVVGSFKGRIANFNNLPYASGGRILNEEQTCTGDAITYPLNLDGSPRDSLLPGVHLHWELPDYFKRGTMEENGKTIQFPQAPNRWLVIRYLTRQTEEGEWEAPSTKSWVVESDYISEKQQQDPDGSYRPTVSVPLPIQPAYKKQPFRYMGRVVEANKWPADKKEEDKYLKDFKDEQGKPYTLTAMGFLGPEFSAYYPDCCSVFGFVDRFSDVEDWEKIPFKVSYQVMGWIEGKDPFDGLEKEIKTKYNKQVERCEKKEVEIDITPLELFEQITKRRFNWTFDRTQITFKLKGKYLASIQIPKKTICSGIHEELNWNLGPAPGSNSFLGHPDLPTDPPSWETKDLNIAIGNSSTEALSALLHREKVKETGASSNQASSKLPNYEVILNALQLGILKDIEDKTNGIIELEEELHATGFESESGGILWDITEVPDPNAVDPKKKKKVKVILPTVVAAKLASLNVAQKDFNMGRKELRVLRRQLYMDWYHYQKELQNDSKNRNALKDFLQAEVEYVQKRGKQVGILKYQIDKKTEAICGIVATGTNEAASLAKKVESIWAEVKTVIDKYKKGWKVISVPAPSFYLPTDPVVVMESDLLELPRRNGTKQQIPIRLSSQLINCIKLKGADKNRTIKPKKMPTNHIPTSPSLLVEDMKAIMAEAHLLIPSLFSSWITREKNIAELSSRGTQIIDGFKREMTKSANLPNLEVQPVSLNNTLVATFTNTKGKGHLPHPIGWTQQTKQAFLSDKRLDPFLPVSLNWELALSPIKKESNVYPKNILTDNFELDEHAIDLDYKKTNIPELLAAPKPIKGTTYISKKATFSLTHQIDNFIENNPSEFDEVLKSISDSFRNREITTQTMSGFNIDQLSKFYIPQIPVNKLTTKKLSKYARPTFLIKKAVDANEDDNWYDDIFNGQAPAPMSRSFFSPLRGGAMSLRNIEIVDVFGQTMKLSSSTKTEGANQVAPAMGFPSPQTDDAKQHKIFLSPRILAPTRLWFRWLGGDHATAEEHDDFVEMNSHPSSSPVCGWIVPNHLDNSLFFYNIDGQSIGSFGLESGRLQYRTRAGNWKNPSDDLTIDLEDAPINEHLANYMRYIHERGPAFLAMLMQTILQSDQYINPSKYAQDPSLAVLMGRPLAITRAVMSMETAGHVLPINQDLRSLVKAAKNNTVSYQDRMKTETAGLDQLNIPLRLGDLDNVDDGLVGYLIEKEGEPTYQGIPFYSSYSLDEKIIPKPSPQTIQLQLNGPPIYLTMLIDPRAPIHATTGLLPVEKLEIPPAHYEDLLQQLHLTFFTMPVLEKRNSLVVPIPTHNGYSWSWVYPGNQLPISLEENAANQNATWDYSPQTLLEGWLKLSPDPKTSEQKTN